MWWNGHRVEQPWGHTPCPLCDRLRGWHCQNCPFQVIGCTRSGSQCDRAVSHEKWYLETRRKTQISPLKLPLLSAPSPLFFQTGRPLRCFNEVFQFSRRSCLCGLIMCYNKFISYAKWFCYSKAYYRYKWVKLHFDGFDSCSDLSGVHWDACHAFISLRIWFFRQLRPPPWCPDFAIDRNPFQLQRAPNLPSGLNGIFLHWRVDSHGERSGPKKI